jgi:hypothetical protein
MIEISFSVPITTPELAASISFFNIERQDKPLPEYGRQKINLMWLVKPNFSDQPSPNLRLRDVRRCRLSEKCRIEFEEGGTNVCSRRRWYRGSTSWKYTASNN